MARAGIAGVRNLADGGEDRTLTRQHFAQRQPDPVDADDAEHVETPQGVDRGYSRRGEVDAADALARRCCSVRRDRRSRYPSRDQSSIMRSSFARSRSTNFWILPVEVFGSGPNTTWRGALKCARRSRQKAMISAASARGAVLQRHEGAGRLAPIAGRAGRRRRLRAPPGGGTARPRPRSSRCSRRPR